MKTMKKRVNTYEVYPKNKVAQTMVYQGMSSHYRRIYNAKPRVDTGPPFSHKPVKPLPPSKLCPWNKKQSGPQDTRKSQSSVCLTNIKCSRESCGQTTLSSFRPQISSTDTESKLRSLRVYHPPRRRVYSSSSTSIQIKSSDPDISIPKTYWARNTTDESKTTQWIATTTDKSETIPWIGTTTEESKTPHSKGSSSDSAYTEEGEGNWSGGESRGPTPTSDSHRTLSTENLLYVKFIRDITEEVLRKGVFTNKALKKICQTHIDSHKHYLNLEKMQKEVDKLQFELGIPKNDDLDGNKSELRYAPSSTVGNIEFKLGEDKELRDALSQLDISASLKADIANSLGLFSTGSYCPYSSVTSTDVKLSRGSSNSKHTTFSTPLEVILNVKRKADVKFPQSDDDSYEMLSEGPESRPLSPLGLAW